LENFVLFFSGGAFGWAKSLPCMVKSPGSSPTLLMEQEKKLCSASFEHLVIPTVSLHPVPVNLNRKAPG
jgi:hypothetical protein